MEITKSLQYPPLDWDSDGFARIEYVATGLICGV